MNESDIILRFLISIIINNAVMNILIAAALHDPLVGPSVFP